MSQDTEDKQSWARWRWEFLRRNENYRRDYAEALKHRKEWISKQDDGKPYSESPEGDIEKGFCEEWDLGIPQMIDPGLSFDELFEKGPGFIHKESEPMAKWAGDLWDKWIVEGALQSNAVQIIHTYDFGHGIGFDSKLNDIKRGDLLLRIDFSKVNSLKALQAIVADLLLSHYDLSRSETHEGEETEIMGEKVTILESKEEPAQKQRYLIDYGPILMVGDMKQKGHTNQQIAEEVFPGDIDPESARIKVIQHYSRFKELVNGGYRFLIA